MTECCRGFVQVQGDCVPQAQAVDTKGQNASLSTVIGTSTLSTMKESPAAVTKETTVTTPATSSVSMETTVVSSETTSSAIQQGTATLAVSSAITTQSNRLDETTLPPDTNKNVLQTTVQLDNTGVTDKTITNLEEGELDTSETNTNVIGTTAAVNVQPIIVNPATTILTTNSEAAANAITSSPEINTNDTISLTTISVDESTRRNEISDLDADAAPTEQPRSDSAVETSSVLSQTEPTAQLSTNNVPDADKVSLITIQGSQSESSISGNADLITKPYIEINAKDTKREIDLTIEDFPNNDLETEVPRVSSTQSPVSDKKIIPFWWLWWLRLLNIIREILKRL